MWNGHSIFIKIHQSFTIFHVEIKKNLIHLIAHFNHFHKINLKNFILPKLMDCFVGLLSSEMRTIFFRYSSFLLPYISLLFFFRSFNLAFKIVGTIDQRYTLTRKWINQLKKYLFVNHVRFAQEYNYDILSNMYIFSIIE